MPRIAFASVGCKLNRYEIQVMSEALRQFDFATVPFSQDADCYVINTCSVTGDADFSSRQLIRRAKRRNPDAKVIATGCYAQLRPGDLAQLGVNAVVSNPEKENLPEIVMGLFDIHSNMAAQPNTTLISNMEGMTRAFTKIQDGCDDQCSFCTIWMARGPVRSRPANQIIEEINRLAANGFKEVALTGVHIGKYSYDSLNFVDLIERLLEKTSIERIRLSSLNPREITDDLIALLKPNSKICPHIHLSLQSGDDDILAAMGRKYTRNDIIAVTERLTGAVPDITIGADFIAGFPGETAEAFENTKRLIEENSLHHLHIFPYSDRPGTKATFMEPKIAAGEKAKRTSILRNMGKSKRTEHLKAFLGRRLRVLFENRVMPGNKIMTGLSENYLRIEAPFDKDCLGQIVDVTPIELSNEHLITKTITGTLTSRK